MKERTNKGKIGIVTFFKGNYGSILQCYATCTALEKLGYSPYVLEKRENRAANLFRFFLRCLRYPKYINTFLTIRKKASSGGARLLEEDRCAMNEFISRELSVLKVSSCDLRKIGKDGRFVAFLSGSDQIWGGHDYAIDPVRFLRFAPLRKRVAWAPSFGSVDIARYNQRRYKKYISQYARLSVREECAVETVYALTGKKPTALVDPVFLLTRDEWLAFAEPLQTTGYVFCYFLDKPSDSTVQQIFGYCTSNGTKAIVFGPCDSFGAFTERRHGGPREFVSLIAHADCVFTDSFHALSFSLLLNTPFWAYRRNYAHGIDQSARIRAILEKVHMTAFFDPNGVEKTARDFSRSDAVFERERIRMQNYLSESVGEVLNENEEDGFEK